MTLTQYFILMQAARAIPLSIGLFNWKKMDTAYRPFFILLALGFVNETISFVLIKTKHSNVYPFNIFQIVECLFLLYQFKVWGFFRKQYYFNTVVLFFIAFWIVQNIGFHQISRFSPYFRVFYAFSVDIIILNKIIYIANENTSVFRNPKFLISTGLIIFFIYQIIFEWALIIDPGGDGNRTGIIIRFLGYMDILTNLLYGWAVFVACRKRSLTLEQNIKSYAGD